MRYLFFLNCAMLALGAVLAVVLAVVCLIYVLYLDREPQLVEELHVLLATTGLFAVVTAGAGMAVWGQWKRRVWHWAGLLIWLLALWLTGLMFSP